LYGIKKMFAQAQINYNTGNINCDHINIRDGMTIKGPITSRSADGKFTFGSDAVFQKDVTVEGNLVAPTMTVTTIDTTTVNTTDVNTTNLNATDVNTTNLSATDVNTTNLNATGEIKAAFIQSQINQYNSLRLKVQDAETLGSALGFGYPGKPFQSGGPQGSGLKLEYNSDCNKYSLPALDVTTTFDLIPSAVEAGVYNAQILAAGFDAPYSRNSVNNWYGLCMDEQNFYYVAWGGFFFVAIRGLGTSSVLVCRRRSDASLVWAMNTRSYNLEIPGQVNYLGGANRIARINPAIYKNRLYIGDVFNNIGPQLYCIDKLTGAPIWTIAYDPPAATGVPQIVSPATPIGSYNGAPYVGSNSALSDLNIIVGEVVTGTPSVFVGVSSFQNALNLPSTSYTKFTDKGKLIRVDDLGTTATKVWTVPLCAPSMNIGDTISSTGPDNLNPFRPGETTTLIWRDTTADGTFSPDPKVTYKVLDFLGANPGFRPVGYPVATNNNTVPIMITKNLVFGGAPLVEADFQDVWRTAAPGIGAGARIYQFWPTSPTTPKTITDVIIDLNARQALLTSGNLVVYVFAYLTGAEALAIDAAALGATNSGVRYVAEISDNYILTNAQEVDAFEYYGNSTWGPCITLDMKRNRAYVGTAQAHACPLDEQLFFQDPAYCHYDTVQPILTAEYRYTQDDAALAGAGPYANVTDINNAKDTFATNMTAQCLDASIRSPRSLISYSDTMMAVDLTTGAIQYAFRTIPWDSWTATTFPPIVAPLALGTDSDVSAGVHLFEDVDLETGGRANILAASTKGGYIVQLDITNVSDTIPWNHTNLIQKGVVPFVTYAGSLSSLGGSNYGGSQSGGKYLTFNLFNNSVFDVRRAVQSQLYQANSNQGYEFHVTRDGKAVQIGSGVCGAYDVSKKKIVWETVLGQQSNTSTFVYNGVMYLSCNLTGITMGIDVKTGEKIWIFNEAPYGLKGFTVPTFSDGQAIYINNYQFVGGGSPGSKGLMMNVKKQNLLTPANVPSNLVYGYNFASFDVSPKVRNGTIFTPLLNPTSITHAWSLSGTLTATHTPLVPPGPAVVYTFAAGTFDYNSRTLNIATPAATPNLRYLSIRFTDCRHYILKYQVFSAGVWVNYEALFTTTSTINTSAAESALIGL